jgi:uncharacterized protein (DUF1015 family)
MPKIFPFRAFRYALPDKKLAQVICPPYDIIGEKLEKELRRNEKNAIAVELPLGEGDQKYANAQALWQDWRMEGTVERDSEPAFYVYEQIFKVKGKKLSRRGFFCELKVEEPGKGSVLRHELTLAGPKADRLNLIRAARINTSPIFGLLSDAQKKVRSIMARAAKGKPLAQVKDRDGVIHKLWPVTAAPDVEAIQKAARENPVLIADGHHRYETSWNYFSERRDQEGEDGPSSRMLFLICPMEDPGMVVFPTHRVCKEKNLQFLLDRLQEKKDLFTWKPSGKGVPKAPFFTITDGKKTFSVKLKSPSTPAKLLGERPKAYLSLVLVHLHSILLPEMKKEDFLYTHDEKEAIALAKSKKTAAILVPPTTVKELNAIVTAGDLMPQKSTYFYPKIITGILFRSLEP